MEKKKERKIKPRPIYPIKDREQVRELKQQAQLMGDQPYMLILLGLNTGLRISDLLPLRVGDFRDRERLIINEKKTGKHADIKINPSVLADIRRMTRKMDEKDLLFPSPHSDKLGQPISYATARRWVQEACRRAGFEECAGCHTLRKTFGYTHYQKTKNVALLMERFNHSKQGVTLRYIGVNQDAMDELSKTLI